MIVFFLFSLYFFLFLFLLFFFFFFFFFNDTATTEIYTLSLHDAPPIYCSQRHTNVSANTTRHGQRRSSAISKSRMDMRGVSKSSRATICSAVRAGRSLSQTSARTIDI